MADAEAKIPEVLEIQPWDNDLDEELELGIGISWGREKVVVVVHKHVRAFGFTAGELRTFIKKLRQNLKTLERGPGRDA